MLPFHRMYTLYDSATHTKNAHDIIKIVNLLSAPRNIAFWKPEKHNLNNFLLYIWIRNFPNFLLEYRMLSKSFSYFKYIAKLKVNVKVVYTISLYIAYILHKNSNIKYMIYSKPLKNKWKVSKYKLHQSTELEKTLLL